MSKQVYEINDLLDRYIKNQLTEDEQEALEQWLRNSDNKETFDFLVDEKNWKSGLEEIHYYKTRQADAKKKFQSGLLTGIPIVPVKKLWVKYAVAATVIAAVATGGIYLLVNHQGNKQATVKTTPAKNTIQDIAPGGDNAVLTLADGSTVVLDNAQNGLISTQGNAEVVKKDGELTYNVLGKNGELAYNKLATPHGGQYRVTLPDGSKAWLNAASSIRYPVVFTGNERKVEISGEVYFEVEKNRGKPFKVEVVQGAANSHKAEVEVLGTHFNINSYVDEPLVRTTLIEGKVKISSLVNDAVAVLEPGEQGQMDNGGSIAVKNADVEAVMAWKNGQFRFSNVDLKSIMRQVSRWYDVDVKFESRVNPGYTFILNRNMNVSKIIEVLEESGGAHFKIEGKTITVLP